MRLVDKVVISTYTTFLIIIVLAIIIGCMNSLYQSVDITVKIDFMKQEKATELKK